MSEIISEIDQLERILNSPPLVTSPSLSRFLRYIVEETLAGRSASIREYTLGVNVFDRGDDFNPRLDPIVRVQARNLRARVQKYYEGAGSADPIRIELPKGTYVPIFHKTVVEPVAAGGATAAAPAIITASVMPVPPPRSPVARPKSNPRYWIAALILFAILVGIAAMVLTQAHAGSRVSFARSVVHVNEPWGILGG